MAVRPGYGQHDPRNPPPNYPHPQQFPQPYQQRRRDYDAESDLSDQYGSGTGSTAQLSIGSPYYDHSSQPDSYSEYPSL